MWLLTTPAALWTAHIAALVVFAMLTVGLFSRLASLLSLVAVLAYISRVPGALFGLDQINLLLAMYLAVGPCGAVYSLDSLRRRRRAERLGQTLPDIEPSIGANIAIRLIQLHMCVIYAFAGTSKLMGPSWWDGTAMWQAFANLEYQSLDMSWLAHWPRLINLMTHVTILWEVYYCALIWPRRTRPWMLALAVPLHLGIGICLGMMTFGTVMLIGNLAFVSPALVRSVMGRLTGWRATVGDNPATSSRPGANAGRAAASESSSTGGPRGRNKKDRQKQR